MTPMDAFDTFVRARRRLYETKAPSHPEFVSAVNAYKDAIDAARIAGCTEEQLASVELLEPADAIIPETVVVH